MELKCMVCCSTNGEAFLQSIDGIGTVGGNQVCSAAVFKSFCVSFLSLQKLQLEEGLALCSLCSTQIVSALKTKTEAEAVEKTVRSLQLNLLGELRKLQSILNSLGESLTIIKESVTNSNKLSRTILGTSCRGNERNRNDVFLFREKVLDANVELDFFRTELAVRNVDVGSGPTAITKGIETEPEVDFHESFLSLDNSCPSPFTNDLFSAAEDTPRKRKANKRTSVSKTKSKKQKQLKSEDDGDEGDFNYYDGDDNELELYHESDNDVGEKNQKRSLIKKKKSSSSSAPAKEKRKKRKHKPGQNYTQTPSDIHTKVDFTGMTPFTKHAMLTLLKQLIFVPTPEYAAKLLKTEADMDDNGGGGGNFDKSPEHHLQKLTEDIKTSFFEYTPPGRNETVGKMSFKGTEILVNEPNHSLDCSKCPFQAELQWPPPNDEATVDRNVKQVMKKHILRKHAEYECPICSAQQHFPQIQLEKYNIRTYSYHLRSHFSLRDHPFGCKICGMISSGDKNALRRHLWTHKNEEEKAEAERNGEANPILKKGSSAGNPDEEGQRPRKSYICVTCGMGFDKSGNLRRHEQTHLRMEDRDIAVCDLCGDRIPKTSFAVHKSQRCSGGVRIKCVYCEITFKNLHCMNVHVKRTHSKNVLERPFKCTTCSKTFKVQSDLKFHSKIHQTAKLYTCSMCSKDFVMLRNLKRHKCRGNNKNLQNQQEESGE